MSSHCVCATNLASVRVTSFMKVSSRVSTRSTGEPAAFHRHHGPCYLTARVRAKEHDEIRDMRRVDEFAGGLLACEELLDGVSVAKAVLLHQLPDPAFDIRRLHSPRADRIARNSVMDRLDCNGARQPKQRCLGGHIVHAVRRGS